MSETHITFEDLKDHEELSAWCEGQVPGSICLERPSGQQCAIDAMALLAQSKDDSPMDDIRMFTFDCGCHNEASLQAVLTTFVVQGISFLFLCTPESKRPETVLEILRQSDPTPDLFILFELVNIWFHQERVRPLWVLWDVHKFDGDLQAISSKLASSCRFSEISPSLLFAGEASETVSAAMRQSHVHTLAVSRTISSEPETEASPDIQALMMGIPGLITPKSDIEGVLEAFSPHPAMRQVVWRVIRKITNLDPLRLDLAVYQPDRPDLIFRNVLETIPDIRRTYIARLLQWLVSSSRSLTISEAATAMSLETLVATNFKTPWQVFTDTGYRKSRQDLELAEGELCGIIRFEANVVDIAFPLPAVRQTLSQNGHRWHLGSDVQTHLRLLERLIQFLELEVDLADDASLSSLNVSQFKLYAAQHWVDHYRVASQSDTTKQLADDLVVRLLKNHDAVHFLLDSTDGLIGREDLQTADSRKVALLARHKFDVGSIKLFSECAAWDLDQTLLFAGFLGAVAGSFTVFVEQVSIMKLKDSSKIEKVLNNASIIASPEFMETLFINISHDATIRIPDSFLMKAFGLRLDKIIVRIFDEPGWLRKTDLDLVFTQCVISGYTDFALRLTATKVLAVDKPLLLNKVLDAAGHNRSAKIVSFVLNFRKGDNLDVWKELETSCTLGTHEAVNEILDKIPDDFTSEAWTSHSSALTTIVSRGYERCTARILRSMAVADSEVQKILRRALIAGVEHMQPNTCQQLLQSCPELLDESTTVDALREAALTSNLKLLQILFASGPPIDADLGGDSVLHIAAEIGDVSTIAYLLSKGADVNARDAHNGATPLIRACDYEHPDAARLLLDYGADPGLTMTAGDCKDWSALEFAVRCPEIISMLVENAPKPNYKRAVEYKDGHATALYLATDWNMSESVKLLLKGDVDLEFEREADSGYQGCFTALTTAVNFGYSDIVRLLLERGANINHIEKDNGWHVMARVEDEQSLIALLEYNPDLLGLNQGLNAVSGYGESINLVTRILNAGAEPNAIDTRDDMRDTPLTNACAYNTDPSLLKLLQLLISKGATIGGTPDSRRGSPLHIACQKQAKDIVEFLLDIGADVNFHVGHLGTPLQMCCASPRDHEAKIQMLVDRGADVHATGSHFNSILTAASFQSSLSSISYLIEHGADVNQADAVGCSPVLAACLRDDDRQDLIEMLVSSGATLDVRDKLGRTILHYAAFGSDLSLVQWLIANEPSLIGARDFDGWSAIHWALMSPFPWSACSVEASINLNQSLLQESDRIAIIHLLVDNGCPGNKETVQVDDGDKWNCIRIARYFGAPLAVQAVMVEFTQSDGIDIANYQTGCELSGGSCDGCYIVSEERHSTLQTDILKTDKCE